MKNSKKCIFLSIFVLTFTINLTAQTLPQDNSNLISSENKNQSSAENQETFQIKNVTFNSKGKTKPYAIKRNITDIDYDRIFLSKEEFENYLKDIRQQITNTRLVENIEFNYVVIEKENNLNIADVIYSFSDSKSFLMFPKPTLDTNSGFELKLKLKDNNFLGTMSDLNIDLNGQLGNTDAPEDWSKFSGGFNFEYEFPFNLGFTENSWSNDFSLSWEFGEAAPDFSYSTGLTVKIPFGHNKLSISGTQSVIRNNDYIIYGDELYFVEKFGVSLPLVLGYLGNTTAVSFTPSVNFTHNWDLNGINENNTDLNQTPMINVAQTIDVSNINWAEKYNFRSGYYFNTVESIGWDFHTQVISEKVVPSFTINAKFFENWKLLSLSVNANFFAGLNTTTKIGEKIRGAADYQTYNIDYNVDSNNYALETPCALTINLDFPIHIITTNWLEWGKNLFGAYNEMSEIKQKIFYIPYKLFSYLDFELQLSPFIDIALLKNRVSGSVFSFREGIYTAGLEVLVYPLRWKSYVVRGSIGYDFSKGILNSKTDYFDSNWRNPARNYEIYFGLGLLY